MLDFQTLATSLLEYNVCGTACIITHDDGICWLEMSLSLITSLAIIGAMICIYSDGLGLIQQVSPLHSLTFFLQSDTEVVNDIPPILSTSGSDELLISLYSGYTQQR
jgi:hypothetical protein